MNVMADIPFRAQLVAGFAATLIFLVVLELVRRRKLKEEYSLLWLIVSAGAAIVAFSRPLIVFLAHSVGARNANSVLFLAGFAFLMLVALHVSVKISALNEQTRNIAQRLALLSNEVTDMRTEKDTR